MTKIELLRQYIHDLKSHVPESPGRENRIAVLEEELEHEQLQNKSSNSDYEKCSHVIGLICGVLDITISECDELNLHEIYPKIVEIKNVVKELSQHFA